MTYTPDEIATAIILEGQTARTTGTPEVIHPVITPRGIQIALATAIVESADQDLANPDDPASEAIPNDGDGTDHASEGDFQQQPPWWGTVQERMDPRLSAAMFYQHLAKLNYNDPNTSPGTFAQDVQGSAFPLRYDQEFAAAVAQYNRLAGQPPEPPVTDPNKPSYNEFPLPCENSQDRNGTTVDLVLLHTEEGGGGNSAAEDLANFLISTTGGSNPVSYHRTLSQASDGGVTVVDCVDTDQACWAVGNSNNRSINMCFAGSYAAWTRDQWMEQSNAIDVAAYLAVQDCLKYGIPLRVIVPYSAPGGVADHRYCTDYLKDGNTHTDVGGPLQAPWTNFPWDFFEASFVKYATGSPAPTPAPGGFDMLSAQQQQDMYNWTMWTYAQLQGFNPAMVQLSLPGCTPTPIGEGWPQLGQNPDGKNLTAIDAIADIKDGVTLPKTP